MTTLTKDNHAIDKVLLAVGITAALTVFCFYSNLSLFIPFLLLLLGVHLFLFRKSSFKIYLQLGLLVALHIFFVNLVTEYYVDISPFYIPAAAIGMLTILLYSDLQLAFMMSFIASVLTGLIVGTGLQLALILFVGSLVGIYCIKDARTRGRLILTGLLVGVVQSISAVLLDPTIIPTITAVDGDRNFYSILRAIADTSSYLKPLFFNGIISALVVMALLKVFETFFGVLTSFSLLELSDFNQPLLRRMILEAPGTYHHSLVVSNIAEAAADAVGANGLLTRVGGYYHDVGKLMKPEYFTENQYAESKHDHLEPTISKLVILNHVKNGIEIARQYKLNQRIIDFIPEHHGTSLIYYFYQRALEDAGSDETVSQESFRYPGPKPQSREAAILLLADSVEGAVRSLEDPTPSRIDEMVRKVINNKFIDGQLDECDLTLRNIETISATFTRVLSAMYHTRIKYPEKKNGNGHSYKKSAEANTDLPESREAGPDSRPGA